MAREAVHATDTEETVTALSLDRPGGQWRPRLRPYAPALADCGAWAAGLSVAMLLLLDVEPAAKIPWGSLVDAVPVAWALAVATGLAVGLYRGRWSIGSFEEVAALVAATSVATVALLAFNMALGHPLPAHRPLIGGVLALGFAATARYVWRLRRDRALRPGARARRLLVLGAGEAGAQVVTQLLRDPTSPYVPVGLLDDDPAKRNLRIRAVPVLGTREDLERVATAVRAEALLVAIPSASTTLLREIVPRAADAGLPVRVLPSLTELLGGEARVTDLRPLAETELLGREPVRIDRVAVAAGVRGRRVLITGAGGSIGSELCRQVARLEPAELVMLDRDESALHTTQLAIDGHARLDSPNLVVADVRDPTRIYEVLGRWRPEVVFHAAALKHLPLLEMHPTEAVKTNVEGTLNVLSAALHAGVDRFVNVSTDKAADPISVLGFTKRLTERLTAWASAQSDGTFLSVRFGNVLRSRGSILTTFQAQIASGGPVTVTHPEVSRFFMTVEEAVQLVLQASVIGRDGEVLVLDMGEPLPILQLAQRLVAGAGDASDIVFTGLRSGEKLHETMLAAGECDHRPFHPRVAQVPVPPLCPDGLERLEQCGQVELVQRLKALCNVTDDGQRAGARGEAFCLVLDPDDRILAASLALRRWLRVREGDYLGDEMLLERWRALHADGSPVERNEYPSVVTRETGAPLDDIVLSVRGADGGYVWFSVATRAVPSPDGRWGVVLRLWSIDWDPDPSRPEVPAAMARARRLCLALETVDA